MKRLYARCIHSYNYILLSLHCSSYSDLSPTNHHAIIVLINYLTFFRRIWKLYVQLEHFLGVFFRSAQNAIAFISSLFQYLRQVLFHSSFFFALVYQVFISGKIIVISPNTLDSPKRMCILEKKVCEDIQRDRPDRSLMKLSTYCETA